VLGWDRKGWDIISGDIRDGGVHKYGGRGFPVLYNIMGYPIVCQIWPIWGEGGPHEAIQWGGGGICIGGFILGQFEFYIEPRSFFY